MNIALQDFLDTHPGCTDNLKPSAELLQRYGGYLPQSLLELWCHAGFGPYSNGLLQLVNPDGYKNALWRWLMRDDQPMDRLPIALTAFGEILYYRRLSDEGDEDICLLDPHTSKCHTLAWSLDEFFNGWCTDTETVQDILSKELFTAALDRNGPLPSGQIYYFTPPLRLGGQRAALGTAVGDAAVHLDFLLELALS